MSADLVERAKADPQAFRVTTQEALREAGAMLLPDGPRLPAWAIYGSRSNLEGLLFTRDTPEVRAALAHVDALAEALDVRF